MQSHKRPRLKETAPSSSIAKIPEEIIPLHECYALFLKNPEKYADQLWNTLFDLWDLFLEKKVELEKLNSGYLIAINDLIYFLMDFYKKIKHPFTDSELEFIFTVKDFFYRQIFAASQSDTTTARMLALEELSRLLDHASCYSKLECYDRQIEMCLQQFANTFNHNDNANLVVNLPTANMFRHASGGGNFECPERLIAAMRGLAAIQNPIHVAIFPYDGFIDIEFFVSKLEDHGTKQLTPKNKKTIPVGRQKDTRINAHTKAAVNDATTNVIEAAKNAVLSNVNGLCLIRPPGHHATRNEIAGFCLRNNVIYGAHAVRHLLPDHKRIIIIDMDIHSGDGTENYVREWDDEKHPLVFINLFHPQNFPYSKEQPFTQQDHKTNPYAEIHSVPVPLNASESISELEGSLILEIEKKINQQPNIGLVLLSIGFDGHSEDPLGAYCLSDNFYKNFFMRLHTLFSQKSVPIVGVLEGGYNLDVIRNGINQFASIFSKPTYQQLLTQHTESHKNGQNSTIARNVPAHAALNLVPAAGVGIYVKAGSR